MLEKVNTICDFHHAVDQLTVKIIKDQKYRFCAVVSIIKNSLKKLEKKAHDSNEEWNKLKQAKTNGTCDEAFILSESNLTINSSPQ